MAIFQHHDVVRPGHGAHPVGDDQHRLAGQQAGEGSLHLGLVLHIQAGGAPQLFKEKQTLARVERG